MATGTEGEPLSNVDAAWLRMEDRTNLMIITAVMSFEDRIDFARLKSIIEDRLLVYDRFRQRVVESKLPFGKPRWVEDEHFNLRHHLQRVALPSPGGKEELQEMVSILMSTPLDSTKPLWQFQVIEDYRGGTAVVARIHHCIADGIALVRVLLEMTDDSPDAPIRPPRGKVERSARLSGASWLPGILDNAIKAALKVTESVVEGGVETLTEPSRAVNVAEKGVEAAGVLGRLLTMPADPDTVFRGPLCTGKRCAWSEILPLADVKAFSKSVGATINDVLLAGVAGGLRRYSKKRGRDVEGVDIRAVIPVNLRPEEEAGQLGNRFGLVYLSLPIGIEDRGERLREVKRRMDAIKSSSEAVVAFAILNALGMASPEVESMAVQMFGKKATAVMTNVPGPREPLYLAGSTIRSMMFWVPQSARLGLGVSIFSYAGQVRLGVATDVGLVPDPDNIIEAFHEEMQELLAGTD